MQSNELAEVIPGAKQPNEVIEVIPVVEEILRIEKREFESGRVLVHKTVTERDEVAEVLLRQQDLIVERVPIGRTVSEAPQTRQDGDTLIVPILEEVLVVEKRLILKEELHIRKHSSERTEQHQVRLRTEHVEIEQTGRKPSEETPSKERPI
jgi:uncharacterized protein (TIGR02271 family)